MLKNSTHSLISLFIILLIIFTIQIILVPVTSATQYGSIQGKVIDRYGNPIAGAMIEVQNGDTKPIANIISKTDGSYLFSQVPIDCGSGVFRIVAKLDANDTQISQNTAFFMVYPLQLTMQDVQFFSYPSSGTGSLYGVVSSYSDRIIPVSAVVYIDNGMYTYYEGGDVSQWCFTLPSGKYVIWAEQNKNLTTYKSQNYSVQVYSDDNGYLPIYLPMKEQARYHVQPAPQKNLIHGQVKQKNGMPLSGATIELRRFGKNGLETVDTVRTNSTGFYIFYNVNVQSVSEKYVVKAMWDLNGEIKEETTSPFDVYYANTIGKQHDYDVPVTMNVVNTGDLDISSNPPGATIWIDGQNTGKLTPQTLKELCIGQHSLTLAIEGYYNDSSSITIEPNQTTNVNRNLSISTGSLYITVKPEDARIYINGIYTGTGTLSQPRKPAGKYTYEIAREGYQNESGSFEVFPGKQTTKNFDMVAVPALSFTYLGYLINNMISSISGLF